jgi:hypothetical protein
MPAERDEFGREIDEEAEQKKSDEEIEKKKRDSAKVKNLLEQILSSPPVSLHA